MSQKQCRGERGQQETESEVGPVGVGGALDEK